MSNYCLLRWNITFLPNNTSSPFDWAEIQYRNEVFTTLHPPCFIILTWEKYKSSSQTHEELPFCFDGNNTPKIGDSVIYLYNLDKNWIVEDITKDTYQAVSSDGKTGFYYPSCFVNDNRTYSEIQKYHYPFSWTWEHPVYFIFWGIILVLFCIFVFAQLINFLKKF